MDENISNLLVSFIMFYYRIMSGAIYSKNKSAIKLYEKARSVLELNEFDIAEKDLATALKADPNFLEAYLLLGDIYRIKQDFLKSKESYRKAFSINPTFGIDRYFYLAETELKSGDYQQAINNFNIYKEKGIQVLRNCV